MDDEAKQAVTQIDSQFHPMRWAWCHSCGWSGCWADVKVKYFRLWNLLTGHRGPEYLLCPKCGGVFFRFRDPAGYTSH